MEVNDSSKRIVGRIPKWAIQSVENDISKYGVDLAWQYFAYDSIVENMSVHDIQIWRAFTKYFKKYGIKEDAV